MRKMEGGVGNWKLEVLLEENKEGEGLGLEMFLRRENRKNLSYFHMVPYNVVSPMKANIQILFAVGSDFEIMLCINMGCWRSN